MSEAMDICMNCTVKGDIDACLKTPCSQHNSWFAKTIIAEAEKQKQDKPVSGFFSREAMKEHSDFHPQPKQEQGEPIGYITNKRQRLNVEIKPNAIVWMPTATDWELPLFTTPQQRKPLTNEQIDEIADTVANMPLVGIVNDFRTRFARAIEAAHGIKE